MEEIESQEIRKWVKNTKQIENNKRRSTKNFRGRKRKAGRIL